MHVACPLNIVAIVIAIYYFIIYYFKYMFYKDSQVAEKLLISGSPSRLTQLETMKDKQC